MHSSNGSAGMTTLAVGMSCIQKEPNPCRWGQSGLLGFQVGGGGITSRVG